MKYVRPEIYELQPHDQEYGVVVAKILPDQIPAYAPHVLRTITGAYARQFEQDTEILPYGTSRDHFKPDDEESYSTQAARMHRYMNRSGSAYWVALSDSFEGPEQTLLGMAKASPSRQGIRKVGKFISTIDRPNCYINDIAASVPRQRVGSALLFAAINDYEPSRLVVADVLPGTEAFFEQYGFNAKHELKEPFIIGGVALALVRYEAQLGDIKDALVEKSPWLAEAA